MRGSMLSMGSTAALGSSREALGGEGTVKSEGGAPVLGREGV